MAEQTFKTPVSKEVAQAEFEKWIEDRRIRPLKRAELQEYEKYIIEAVEYGIVTFESKDGHFCITQKLEEPIEGVEVIEFKPRIKVQIAQNAIRAHSNSADQQGAILAKCTNIGNSKLIPLLDQSDFSLANSILMYFL